MSNVHICCNDIEWSKHSQIIFVTSKQQMRACFYSRLLFYMHKPSVIKQSILLMHQIIAKDADKYITNAHIATAAILQECDS